MEYEPTALDHIAKSTLYYKLFKLNIKYFF